MRFLNFGSLNIDITLTVEHIALPGETVSVLSASENIGGKGLNQSIALGRAGAHVCHAGCVGHDGSRLTDYLKENDIDITHIRALATDTGKAYIQVSRDGQNSIAVYGGANQKIDRGFADYTLSSFGAGDVLLLQNEISCTDYIMREAHAAGMTVVFNPSPSGGLKKSDLTAVDMFILNESECTALTGETDTEKMPDAMLKTFPGSKTVLTLGAEGAVFADESGTVRVPAKKVTALDTTAAGDTFTGYFLNDYFTQGNPARALKTAAAAAAIAVTRPGAAESIPYAIELI